MTLVQLSPEIEQALAAGQAVVALESTVITHGLPYPQNLELALQMETEVRQQGAIPATIAVLEGLICAGLTPAELERLAAGSGLRKISSRDYGPALAQRASGGTTVAGTLVAARLAGIQVFATGGIGGVHRALPGEAAFDISADLTELGRSPVVVVCAGAKAILDLPATLEMLETLAVPVVGYRCDDFPAFYSTSSGLPVSARAETPAEIAEIARRQWNLGLSSAVLAAQPPPAAEALPPEQINAVIEQALVEAQAAGVRGQAVTPFLLARVSQLSGGSSMHANLALLRNNARLAAQIALALTN